MSRRATLSLAALVLWALAPAFLAAQSQPGRPGPGGSGGRGTAPGGYTGPTGGGQPTYQGPTGGQPPNPDPVPAGGGHPTPPGGGGKPPAGPGGGGPAPVPTGPVGPTGGGIGGGGQTGGPRGPTPGPAGPGPSRPDPGGAARRAIRRGSTTPSGLPFPQGRWENWWILNQDRFLDIDRRYTTRALVREPTSDEFLGRVLVEDPAVPVATHRRAAQRRVIPVLLTQLANRRSVIRGEAALALGKVGGADVVAPLVERSRDGNRFVRQMALLGLGLTQEHRAASALAQFLFDRDQQDADRAVAALALGVAGDPVGVPALASVLHESGRERSVVASALYALGFVGGDDAALVLIDFLERTGEQADLRAVATLAAGKLGERRIVPRLLGLLDAPETQVRRSAALALAGQPFVSELWKRRDEQLADLKAWKTRGTLTPEARRGFEAHLAELEHRAALETRALQKLRRAAVTALSKAIGEDSDPMVRNFAAIALGRIGGPDVARALVGHFYGTRSNSTKGFLALALGVCGAREAVPELRKVLVRERKDQSTRSAVSLALGMLQDESSGRVLLDLALGRANTIRAFAAVGCGLMNLQEAKEPFRAELEDESQAYLRPDFGLALGLLGDHRATQKLKQLLLEGPAGITRIQAARALGRIRDLTSVSALVDALEIQNLTDEARSEVIHAIGEVAEKGELPVIEPLARDWNYLLPFPLINDALTR